MLAFGGLALVARAGKYRQQVSNLHSTEAGDLQSPVITNSTGLIDPPPALRSNTAQTVGTGGTCYALADRPARASRGGTWGDWRVTLPLLHGFTARPLNFWVQPQYQEGISKSRQSLCRSGALPLSYPGINSLTLCRKTGPIYIGFSE